MAKLKLLFNNFGWQDIQNFYISLPFTPLCVAVICLVRWRGGGDLVVVALHMNDGVVGCLGEGRGPRVVLDLASSIANAMLLYFFESSFVTRQFRRGGCGAVTDDVIVEQS